MSGTAVPKWVGTSESSYTMTLLSQSQSARGVGQGGVRWSPLPCPPPGPGIVTRTSGEPPKRTPALNHQPPTLGDTAPPRTYSSRARAAGSGDRHVCPFPCASTGASASGESHRGRGRGSGAPTARKRAGTGGISSEGASRHASGTHNASGFDTLRRPVCHSRLVASHCTPARLCGTEAAR